MAYYAKNLGPFGSHLTIDLDGRVPEPGESPWDLRWQRRRWSREAWAAYQAEVREAERQLDEWEADRSRPSHFVAG